MSGVATTNAGASGSDTGSAVEDNFDTAPDGANAARPSVGMSLSRLGYLLPVAVFLIVGMGLGIGLTRDPSALPSALIGKSVPVFDLPPLEATGKPGLGNTDLTGKVQLVNVFASWCGPCRVEHPILMKLAKAGVPLQALNYKDNPKDAARFLAELGDPYEKIGTDTNGRTGIEWGVYGVPETFIIDAEGKIRHKHVGPLQAGDVDELMNIIKGLAG